MGTSGGTANTVIVGVEPRRAEQADALALGATLARLTDSGLLLVSVYEPREAPWHHAGAAHEHALHKAVAGLQAKLEGLETEQLVRPGASAARVLHVLADQHDAQAVVVASSPRAPWGQVGLGHVSQRLLHGGGAPTVVAPRGYASREGGVGTIGVGYVDTPEALDALHRAAALAARAGATLRVITVFDPADYVHLMEQAQSVADLRAHAQRKLEEAVSSISDDVSAAGELLDGDPAQALASVSPELDLLVLGSRSYGPLRAVLLGGVSGVLAHHAGCPMMVVPHTSTPELETTLVGGLEAPRGA
jgi:nucleotide-binding universal stress UspA family protein